jgi:hypothetical protein
MNCICFSVLEFIGGELAFGRLALLYQRRLLGILGLDVAHVARALLGDKMSDERVDLLESARLYVGMQKSFGDRAIGVVAQHLAVEERVDEEARYVRVVLVVAADLGLILGGQLCRARFVRTASETKTREDSYQFQGKCHLSSYKRAERKRKSNRLYKQ